MLLKLALLASALAVLGEAENDYTIIIGAGKRDCYFETFKKNVEFEIEYQVVDGGDLDISFQAFDPKGKQLFTDHRQEDGLHSVVAESNPGGDFQICFDNRHSRFQAKTVFFEFFIMDDDYEYDDYDSEEYLDFQKNLKKDDYEEDTLKSLTDRLHKIKQNHGKTMQYQAFIRAHEARDRNVIEHNYERVNFWSAIHMLAMICTAIFQVFFLRSLFANAGTKGQRA